MYFILKMISEVWCSCIFNGDSWSIFTIHTYIQEAYAAQTITCPLRPSFWYIKRVCCMVLEESLVGGCDILNLMCLTEYVMHHYIIIIIKVHVFVFSKLCIKFLFHCAIEILLSCMMQFHVHVQLLLTWLWYIANMLNHHNSLANLNCTIV